MIGTYLAGGLLLISALAVVLLRSLEQAAFAFVGCLLMVAVLARLLDSPAVAAVQLVIAILALLGLRVVPGFRLEGVPSPFSGQLIAGAIAAAAVLIVLLVALLRGSWQTVEPATGTTWGEYAIGGVIATLTLVVAVLGVLALPPIRSRQPSTAEAPATRRKRDRR